MTRRAPTFRRFLACWGNLEFGRCGLDANVQEAFVPKIVKDFGRDTQPVQVACGGAHTVVLADRGRVFTFGLNSHGQLGLDMDKPDASKPHFLKLPERIKSVAAGHYHTLMVSEKGNLWVCGSNENGQLGLGERGGCSPEPQVVQDLQGAVIGVAAGAGHTLAVTKSGEVYSWGRGGDGQLGHGPGFMGFMSPQNAAFPRLIRELDGIKIRKVASGHQHSGCVDDLGHAYTWGSARLGQLGYEPDKNSQYVPHMVPSSHHVSSLALGGNHSVCVRDSKVYVWGSGDNGCLGLGRDIHDTIRPLPLRRPGMRHVSTGWKHTLGIACDGSLWAWGWGGSMGEVSSLEGGSGTGGQLGVGNDFDFWDPARCDLREVEEYGGSGAEVLQVSCGFNHSSAVVEMKE